MHLTYIVFVVAGSIFACCEGASSASDSKSFAVPQRHVQTENNGDRFLRVPQNAGEERFTEAAENLTKTKSLSDLLKLDNVANPKPIPGKVLSEVLKLDDVAYLKAGGKWKPVDTTGGKLLSDISKLDDATALKVLNEDNKAIFQRIEKLNWNPDSMLMTMKQWDNNQVDLILLKHYTDYWMAKHPTWTSSL